MLDIRTAAPCKARVNELINIMKRTVLLIDDSKFLRRANELAISRSGYSVLVAADGEEGLRLAREKIPDIIVLDMMLPKLSGPQLLQALKHNPETAHIPVIVLSSLPQSNAPKLLSDGAAAYFEKSKLGVENGSVELIRAIESVLHRQSA
jgi:CheY-like chemotaxis protein